MKECWVRTEFQFSFTLMIIQKEKKSIETGWISPKYYQVPKYSKVPIVLNGHSRFCFKPIIILSQPKLELPTRVFTKSILVYHDQIISLINFDGFIYTKCKRKARDNLLSCFVDTKLYDIENIHPYSPYITPCFSQFRKINFSFSQKLDFKNAIFGE